MREEAALSQELVIEKRETALDQDFEIEQTSQVGTPFYLAPELFDREGAYSPKSDMWAVGIILYELLC